jgi:uncharacterized protein YndB with AHSA1/START domain
MTPSETDDQKASAAGMAVPSFDPVEIKRYFCVSPHTLFDAWITRSVMYRWLFASDSGELVRIDVDPRVGGTFFILERREEGEIDHFGTYLEVNRPSRLAFTLEVPQHFPGSTQVRVDIGPTPAGSELTFLQIGVDPATTCGAWQVMFDQLNDVLSNPAAL